MRLYGKRSIGNAIKRSTALAAESRDAIVWDILTADRAARCKIQGSDELVVACWPSSWSSQPIWLRAGQTVRIIHRGGQRGFVELVGLGQTIPTPISGDSPSRPDLPPDSDAIMSGGKVVQNSAGPQMSIQVSAGTVRIGGQLYSIPQTTFSVTGVPQGQFRQDIIVINSSGVLQYIQGTAFTTTEVIPAIPANCLLLNNIFVIGGRSVISQADIGANYQVPYLATLGATFETISGNYYGTWTQGTGYVVDFSALDQYGNTLIGKWTESLAVASGSATISLISAGKWFIGAATATQAATLTYTISSADTSTQLGLTIPLSTSAQTGATALSQLSDVDVSTAPTDGQSLNFEAASGKWKPQTPAATGGAVPAGGATGQVLAKVSDTDYDTDWIDAPTGGGGGGSWKGAQAKFAYTIVSGNTWESMPLTILTDTSNFFNAANNTRYTVPAGITKIRLKAVIRADTGNFNNQWLFYKNGVMMSTDDGNAVGNIPQHYINNGDFIESAVLTVSQGDYFELRAYCVGSQHFIGWVSIEVVE